MPQADVSENLDYVQPDWPAPASITALCTTRAGGASQGDFAGLNLATHVEDNIEHVALNRQRLVENLDLASEPQWLQQTHSTNVINLNSEHLREGDAAITSQPGTVAVVLTADCLPVLLCNRQGNEIAAAHAGWRGLLNGVLEQTVGQMQSSANNLMAWLGPAIGPDQFEVGEEVRQAFIEQDGATKIFFRQTHAGHYLADLYLIAGLRLKNMGVTSIYGGEFCTYTQADRFYSYRRQKVTGRQACLIYINK